MVATLPCSGRTQPLFEASISPSEAATVHRLRSVAVTYVSAQEGHSFPKAGDQVFDGPDSAGSSRSISMLAKTGLLVERLTQLLPTHSTAGCAIGMA